MRRVKLAYMSELDDQHATLYIPTVLEGGISPPSYTLHNRTTTGISRPSTQSKIIEQGRKDA